jgi:hypothetical protein
VTWYKFVPKPKNPTWNRDEKNMYSKDHIIIEKNDVHSKELLLGGHMKWRNKRFEQWLKEEQSENAEVGIETHLPVSILPSTVMTSERTTFGKAVLPKLQ